jgi:hypothetical protein
MTIAIPTGVALSDQELLVEVKRLSCLEQQATACLIAALAELDARRLYLAEGCSSLFTYCTEVLHLSEHAAYLRIEAARAVRKWPVIIELIADSSLHLTAVSLLAPHLTADNHRDVLESARHKSKRAVEEIVAALRPQPPVPSSVRKLPARLAAERTETVSDSWFDQPASREPVATAVTSASPQRPAVEPSAAGRSVPKVTPLAPERYKVQFTISRETHDRLREAQDLLRHRIPDGDVAAIFDRALTLLLADLRKTRHAAAHRPRPQRSNRPLGRYVPAAVKREVWRRDGGRCAFIGTHGRCRERGFLEYHHVVPHAGGGATTADNLELRCRAHNACEAARWFGVGKDDFVREDQAAYIATG